MSRGSVPAALCLVVMLVGSRLCQQLRAFAGRPPCRLTPRPRALATRAMKFSKFAQFLEEASQISGPGSRHRRIQRILTLFEAVRSTEEMKLVLKLMLCDLDKINVGHALLLAAADEMGLKSTKKPAEKLAQWLSRGDVPDVGEGWQRLLKKEGTAGTVEDWNLQQVWEALEKISEIQSEGAVQKRTQLVGKLATGCGRKEPAGGKFICRIMYGKGLGIGANKKTVAKAFAKQRLVPNGERLLEMLEVNPDIDRVLESLEGDCQALAQLWSPITPACAQPSRSVEEVMQKIHTKGKSMNWRAEWKYDGERLQIHADKKSKQVRLFSRNLNNVTGRFPQVLDAMITDKHNFENIILDAEVVAVDGDRILPFQILSRRPRQAQGRTKQQDVADVAFFVFDCLFVDGESILHQPLKERRSRVWKVLSKSDQIRIAEGQAFTDAKELQVALGKSIRASTEGLILKNLDSPYEPGVRTAEWLKLKKDYLDSSLSDSIDAVAVGVRRGNGQRSSVYGSFLLAVRSKGSSGHCKFQTICAVGTGLTNQVLNDLYELCQPLVSDSGVVPDFLDATSAGSKGWMWIKDFWKAPVMEITAADLTESSVHSCGLGHLENSTAIGLRFPRVLRLRPDKGPEQATTTEQVVSMYNDQPQIKSVRRSTKGSGKPKAEPMTKRFRFEGCEGEADAGGYCVGRAHRPSERTFVMEVLARWPEFRPFHVHSRRVFRHGLTLLQRGGLLTKENPWGAF
ncbi:unnamed protein product [Durusdinium trenchii]|uniref:DNA ligase 1 n=1 Tax=Durusdinium trenchii TaxID=1381693 RepID=A0ABP0NPP5_9DINO